MKILYGVQATGNGHITRARTIAPCLKHAGIEVDYLFSGRPADELFDMEAFGHYQICKGLSFVANNGKIDLIKTVQQNSISTLLKEIKKLDTRQYDLVITDFEPVTAWAAKLQGTPSLGVGHQYAFESAIPKAEQNWHSNTIIKWFAPARHQLGVHWHHFGYPILPPIIESQHYAAEPEPNTVLVYLPFEDPNRVLEQLLKIKGYQFHFHSAGIAAGQYKHVTVHPFGHQQFHLNLAKAQSVLCNAGFELVSEALQLGKRIMVKPLRGQMEQASNAKALSQLNLAWVCTEINGENIQHWLAKGSIERMHYPDVAHAIVQWLKRHDWSQSASPDIQQLSHKLWHQVSSSKHPALFATSPISD